MANVNIWVANPTAADVVVAGAGTAVQGTITNLVIANTGDDAYDFLAAGCSLSPDASSVEDRAKQAFLLERLAHRQ